jgi:hypothetical protein
VRDIVRDVAMEKGCAFWDLYGAMGGAGSAGRWVDRGLLKQDLIHPVGGGADLIGHLFDFALERARTGRPNAPSPRPTEPPGLVDPSGNALARTYAKLGDLATWKRRGSAGLRRTARRVSYRGSHVHSTSGVRSS